jgi:hypothetical protein
MKTEKVETEIKRHGRGGGMIELDKDGGLPESQLHCGLNRDPSRGMRRKRKRILQSWYKTETTSIHQEPEITSSISGNKKYRMFHILHSSGYVSAGTAPAAPIGRSLGE